VLLDPSGSVQSVPGQFGRELVCLETVFTWMNGESAEYPRVQHVAGDLLEEQQTAGPQYAGDLTNGLLPIGHVMDDPEVDDGVDRARRLLDRADVAHRQRHRAALQSASRQFDHRVVEIECGDAGGPESVQDHLGADALPATNLQHVLTRQRAAGQSAEPRRFPVVLMRGAHRVIHESAFNRVEPHIADGTPVGYDPKGLRLAAMAASAVMRILVQRVTSASVTVGGDVVGTISPDGQGLLALVGVTHTDDAAKAQRLAEKLWQLRILDDEKSASDVGAPILVVSQFTLYANTAKGRRPTWNAAAPGAVAEPLVTVFADALRRLGAHVETGVFGADMQVHLVNDGPVTVLLEL
jgi:D-tyrosyl-tRNA(Tyr) deacylase